MDRCPVLPILLVALTTLGGCASIVNGKRQTLQFESRPSGAKVFIEGHELGRTPIATELRRNRSYTVRVERNGYETFVIRLEHTVSGWYPLNIVWGGLFFVGLIVDSLAGSMYELTPREMTGRGRMILHEGKRTYLRIRLQPVAAGRPPDVTTVAKLLHPCRNCAPTLPGPSQTKGGRRDAAGHR